MIGRGDRLYASANDYREQEGLISSYDWRYVLHADLDAFYASVEQLDNPQYLGLPLVVGGAPEERGVVAAASYEARKYGIRSAMPMSTAVRHCSQLVRVAPRFDRYREISRHVMDILLEITPLVEPVSLDEAYVDVTIVLTWERANQLATDLKTKIKADTGLVVSIGGGRSKNVAKVASQLAKPDGLLLIKPGDERRFLGPLAVDILWGVGPKTAEVLRGNGITTLGELSACSDLWLLQTFGKRGRGLKERALGKDNAMVTPHRQLKSVSAEITMSRDVEHEVDLVESLQHLSQGVASRLRVQGLTGKTVFIKLRLSDFTTMTRQITLSTPTSTADVISHLACGMLRRELQAGRTFRLVGVGVTGFQNFMQLPLFPSM